MSKVTELAEAVAPLRIGRESWIPENDDWVREASPFADDGDLSDVGFGTTAIWHYKGVSWHDAPAPRRWHRHFPQTYGAMDLRQVFRCPCGAIADNIGQVWVLLDPPRVKGLVR